MEFNAAAIAATTRRLRIERNLSQEILSGLAGVARAHLTMIENGDTIPTVKTLWKISGALNMP